LATAEIVAEEAGRLVPGRPVTEQAGPPIRPDRRLREIDAGLWNTLSFDEARRLYPREYAERERDLVGYRFPGGESFRDLQLRVVPALLDILDRDGGAILAVAHRGVNRVLLCHLLDLPLAELFSIDQDYCCVNVIRASTLPDGTRRTEVTAAVDRIPERPSG
jgi:broad specificity phosphatase PhoE